MNDLPPFYIGQKVVCVDTSTYNITFSISIPIKNKEYYIKDLRKCSCGEWKCDVGINSDRDFYLICNVCNKSYDVYEGGRRWFTTKRFRPVQEQKFPLIQLSKVVEKEKELISAN